MDAAGVIVKRYRGGGGGGGGGGGDGDKCYLSFLSPRDFSPKVLCQDLNLPPYVEDGEIDFSKCGEWLHLDDYEGNIALFNLTTKELKLLPPPHLETPQDTVVFNGTGLGYDSMSDDYKVVRDLTEWYVDEEDNETGRIRRLTELYSFKSGYWKEISGPAASISSTSGVYINGNCYWRGYKSGGFHIIISFNFTSESFHCLHELPSSEGLDLVIDLVVCRGSLGAIGYEKRSEISKTFVLWVLEERSWSRVFNIVLYGVERPLGLKDGQFLFLEGPKRSDEELSQLLVYDFITKERKELDIYDYPGQMKVISYVDILPDAKPMHRRRKRRLGVASVGIGLKTVMMKNGVRTRRKKDNSHSARIMHKSRLLATRKSTRL